MEWLPGLLQPEWIESVIFSRVVETPVYDNISRDTGQGLLKLEVS